MNGFAENTTTRYISKTNFKLCTAREVKHYMCVHYRMSNQGIDVWEARKSGPIPFSFLFCLEGREKKGKRDYSLRAQTSQDPVLVDSVTISSAYQSLWMQPGRDSFVILFTGESFHAPIQQTGFGKWFCMSVLSNALGGCIERISVLLGSPTSET